MIAPADVLEAGTRGTAPAYVYDLSELDRRCAALEELPVERKSICFATMANDHPAVLRRIRELGHGVFVNSPLHLELALAAGFDPEQIVYAATNMLPDELASCVGAGVRLVVDSIGQIEALAEAGGGGQDIGLRVDVGSAIEGDAIERNPLYRFGVEPWELAHAVRVARRAGIRITGVHAYFGTDLRSPDVLLDGLDRLCEAAALVPDIEFVDVAGGLGVGIGEEFDLDRYGRLAAGIIEVHERRLGRQIELVIEPGRYLAATCGWFFVTVVDVKERYDRTFAGTNGSVANFPRPLLYPDRAVHPCAIVGRELDCPHAKPLYVCGNSTYSRDFLARDVALPLPAPGDRLVFGQAGAYCRSMITEFLGKPRPGEVVLEDRPALVAARSDA